VEEQDIDKAIIGVAIIGRPNVGKSSLVNGITGALRHTHSRPTLSRR